MKKVINTNYLKTPIAIGLVFLLLTSCNVTQKYTSPSSNTSETYRNSEKNDTISIATIKWKEFFTDAKLQALLEQGISKNFDLQIGYTRLRQAQAYYKQSKNDFFPTVTANANASTAKLSEAQGFGIRTHLDQYQLNLSSSWEVDVWGKINSRKKARFAALMQSEAGVRAIQTEIISQIADNYYTLIALDSQLKITEQTVKNWEVTVANMKELKTASIVTEAAVVQSEAQQYSAEVTIPDLKQRIIETENVLNILIGKGPGAIDRSTIEDAKIPVKISSGIPFQLLSNRPDIVEAELTYRQDFELTNVSRTAFYPSLVITATGGYSGLDINKLINPSNLATNIAAALTQPIFNRKLNRMNLEISKEQQQASLLNFNKKLLVAEQEVSNALSLHQFALDKMLIRQKQLNSLQKSVEYTEELLSGGFANYNEVITARQSLLSSELGGVNDKLQQLRAIIYLYRSLGGGWK